MKKHFVVFCSPGTFVDETTQREIASWDQQEAVKMAHDIVERHGATPYGFYFTTRERGPDNLDSKQTESSEMYYLGGKVETLAEVEARATKADEILLSNMRNNGYARIITNTNSWRVTKPFSDRDTVLDFTPRKVAA